MINRIYIKDNKQTPVYYLNELKAFKNGTEFKFSPGINVIIGENGSGKSTLMKLIESYLLVDKQTRAFGFFNKNINNLFPYLTDNDHMLDGVEVFGDYDKQIFRLCRHSELSDDDVLKSMSTLSTWLSQTNSSTGQSTLIGLRSLINKMFNEDTELTFDCKAQNDKYPLYTKYVEEHHEAGTPYTLLLDEPDNNLSLDSLKEIMCFFEQKRSDIQVIGVLHNPLMIYKLSKDKDINFIEMSKGYKKKIIKSVNEIVRG